VINEQRLIDLETKFSHQDILIEEMRQTLHEQYLTIEKLEKNVKVLTEQLKGSEDIRPNEKPPHY
jgi:SlyX protein